MGIRDRLEALEKNQTARDPIRVIYAAAGVDEDAERARYREETGYRGPIVVMDEVDREL